MTESVGESAPVHRPAAVTFVVVLAYISAVVNLLSGILLVLLAGNTQAQDAVGAGRGVIIAGGVLSILVGIVTFLVAGGLRHGRRGARTVVTVVLAIQVVAALATLAIDHSGISQLLVQIAVSVAVIALLWTGAAKDYFQQHSA